MLYTVEHETKHRLRIRLGCRRLTGEQANILKYAFGSVSGVTGVTVYPATAGCAIEFNCDRQEVIRRLDAFHFENVRMMARKQEEQKAAISSAEMKDRKLDPDLKRRLRLRILGEAVADAVLPLPVQLAYHAYQMVTLRNL